MNRLTKKDYEIGLQVNGYYTKKNAQRLTDISHKLGKLEDIMEHFKINSIDQLINILEAWEVVKNKSVDIHDVIHCSSLDVFNCGLYEKYQLTEEEYNKVKKALEVENA